MEDPQIDNDLIDETVLGLLFLTLHEDRGPFSVARAWKSFDWGVMERLHAKDLIRNPVGKAKSVVLTDEGRRRSEEAFYRLFTRKGGPGSAAGSVEPQSSNAIAKAHRER